MVLERIEHAPLGNEDVEVAVEASATPTYPF